MWKLLRSQKTGIICSFLSAALLGAGSIVMDRLPERYEGLALDDVGFFFDRWDPAHLWFYALALTLALWAFSSVVCTWDGVLVRLRRRVFRFSAWGTTILHLAFPLALVGHLWGGLGGSLAYHRIGTTPVVIGDASLRLERVETESYPNGMPRYVRATLEREREGHADEVGIGYNEPLVQSGGAWSLLLMRHVQGQRAVFRVDGQRVALEPGGSAALGPRSLRMGRMFQRPGLRVPVAEVFVEGSEPQRVWLPLGSQTEDGSMAFEGLEPASSLIVMERYNPSAPLVLVVALGAVLGVALTIFERRRGQPLATGRVDTA